MKYARKIKELLLRAYRPDADRPEPMDERILSDANATMKRAVADHQGRHRIELWRRIMKSPYTRTAAMLAIALAAFSVLFPPRNGIVPASVALADVQKAVQAKETVYATGTRTITFVEKPTFYPPVMAGLFEKESNEDGTFKLEFRAESFLSPAGFAHKVYSEDGELVMQAGIHNETGVAIVLLPTAKAYVRSQMLEAYQERMAGFTIQGFIDLLYRTGEYRKVGPKRVQGVDAVGFEVSGWEERILEGFSPTIIKLLFNLEAGTGRVWIDPKTNLPVQTEGEVKLKPCVVSFFKDATAKQIDDNLQWDVEIDETLFSPEIPEDYQELSLPSNMTVGAVASGVALAGAAPWCLFFVRRSRRRAAARSIR